MWPILIAALLGLTSEEAVSDPCDPAHLRPSYALLEEGEVLSWTTIDQVPTSCSGASRELSDSKAFYYLECTDPNDRRVIVGAGDQLHQFHVEGYGYRPLRAQWINEKLLYITFSWNPHAGAYWILDVDKLEIVIAERGLEDVREVARCAAKHDD